MTVAFQSFADADLPPVPDTYLDDKTYALGLDTFVKGCCDIVIQHGQRFLMAKRTIKPHPDWWFIGGRMAHGLSIEQNLDRILRREVGLARSAPPELLTVTHYRWRDRQQAPQHHGTSDLVLTFRYVLRSMDPLAFDAREYGGEGATYRWVTRDEILHDASLHPAIHFIAQHLRPTPDTVGVCGTPAVIKN